MARPTDVQRVTRGPKRPRGPRPETREEYTRRVRGVVMPSDLDPAVGQSGPVTTYRQRAVPADAAGMPLWHKPARPVPPTVTIGKTTWLNLTRSAAEHLGAPRVDVRYSATARQLWLIAADEAARSPRLVIRRQGSALCCSAMLRLLRDEHGIAPGRYPAELVLTGDGRKALVVQF